MKTTLGLHLHYRHIKTIYFIVLSLMSSFYSHAQTLLSSHAPRPGDAVEVMLTNMTSAGEGGKNAAWDYSHLKFEGNGTVAKFYQTPTNEELLVREYLGSSTYYLLENDTLKNYGNENNQQKILWDYCENSVVYPMNYGDSLSGYVYGRGNYCMRYPLRAYGIYRTMADGVGEMKTPEGHLLKNVIRLYMHRELSFHYYQSGEIHLPILAVSSDSVNSIVANDPSAIVVDEYKWYARGYRYPILEYTETCKATSPSDKIVFSAYCSPNSQKYDLCDEENENIRFADNEEAQMGEGTNQNHENFDYEFSHDPNNKSVSITIESKETLDIEIVLASVNGMIYKTERRRNDSSTSIQLSYASYPRGQYAIYIKVGDEIITEKFENNQ